MKIIDKSLFDLKTSNENINMLFNYLQRLYIVGDNIYFMLSVPDVNYSIITCHDDTEALEHYHRIKFGEKTNIDINKVLNDLNAYSGDLTIFTLSKEGECIDSKQYTVKFEASESMLDYENYIDIHNILVIANKLS